MTLQTELDGMPERIRESVICRAPGRWAVDPSTRGVAVSWEPGRALSMLFPQRDGPERLSMIYAATFDLARSIARMCPPGLILFEQPSGQPNRELEWACAVISMGLHDAALATTGKRPVQRLIVASRWKSIVCGYGGIRKPKPSQIRAGARYQVEEWCEAQGWKPGSWDEADAMAMRVFSDLMFDVRVR